jgi:hypothetical protein
LESNRDHRPAIEDLPDTGPPACSSKWYQIAPCAGSRPEAMAQILYDITIQTTR